MFVYGNNTQKQKIKHKNKTLSGSGETTYATLGAEMLYCLYVKGICLWHAPQAMFYTLSVLQRVSSFIQLVLRGYAILSVL